MSANGTYTHWGTLVMGNGNTMPEPNGKGPPPQQCVAANFTQAWVDNSTVGGNVSAFGWADQRCISKFVAICRIMREWRHRLQVWQQRLVLEALWLFASGHCAGSGDGMACAVGTRSQATNLLSLQCTAYQVFHYTSRLFNNTYKFNNQPMSLQAAEETCKCQGGHLASYTDQTEQAEVEKYFLDQVRRVQRGAMWAAVSSGVCER